MPTGHGGLSGSPSLWGPGLYPEVSPSIVWVCGFRPGQVSSQATPLTTGSAGSRSRHQAWGSCTHPRAPAAQQSLWLSLQRPHTEQVGKQVLPDLPAASGPESGPSQDPSGAGGVAVEDPEALLTITVQCAFTLTLKAPRGADLSSLRALLSQALPLQAQCGQLSYRDPGDGHWVPLPEEEALQRAWWDAGSGPTGLQLQCRGVGGRPVLYQAVAQHGYCAQGPEDLDLQPGDTVDVLCEVDQAWLEGHCDGRVGIFPKSFVVPAGQCVRCRAPPPPGPSEVSSEGSRGKKV